MGALRVLDAQDRLEVQDLLFRFMRSFDEKDWDTMRACLADTVECDYASFRGTPPSAISRDDYVDQRKVALASLRTQHNLTNLSLTNLSIDGSGIEVVATGNYAILRFHPDFDGSPDQFFHSYGQYRFTVSHHGDAWCIRSIEQRLLMNEGNRDLHGAFQK